MPVDQSQTILLPLLLQNATWLIFQIGVLTLALVYFIFSLIIVRQVDLMTDILITEVAPSIKAFSIVHAGLALGLVVLLAGLIFS